MTSICDALAATAERISNAAATTLRVFFILISPSVWRSEPRFEISAGVEYPKWGIVASTKVLLQKFFYGSNESGTFSVIAATLPARTFAYYSLIIG